jgi:hypothetical protein
MNDYKHRSTKKQLYTLVDIHIGKSLSPGAMTFQIYQR